MTTTISVEDAEEYTQSLGQILGGSWRQIALAERLGVPDALGLNTQEWVQERLGGYTRLSVSERREAVAELANEGMSQRQIGNVLGVDPATVNRDLKPVANATPDPERGPEPQVTPSADANPVANATPDSVFDFDELDESDPEPPAKPVRNSDDEWYTPRWLFDALGVRYSIDVCAPVDRTHSSVPADGHFTAEDDGLAHPWHGTVWCNPPYSQTDPWARRMIHHGDGLILCHVPMNAGWCAELWDACDGIRLFQAMEFIRPDGSSQRPAWWLQLAAFGPVATDALARLQPLGNAAFNKRRVASPMWRRA